MAYDAKRKQVVMFGGAVDTSGNVIDDTWAWDGTVWTRVATGGPFPRAQATMAYDPIHEQIVMFGGVDMGQQRLDDTQLWDGTSWMVSVPPVRPPRRSAHVMAWNPARRRITMFGGTTGTTGTTGNGELDDAWEWDGTTWREVPTSVSAGTRQFAGVASASSGITMMGGQNPIRLIASTETLRWTGDRPLEVCTIGIDVDGDGAAGCADPDCWGICAPSCPPYTTCDPSAPHCGDGTCAVYETCGACPSDCGACP
jgi:hypothetical protein